MLLNDMCINKPITDEQLTITLAAIKIMELLVELTEDHLSKYHGDLCYALIPLIVTQAQKQTELCEHRTL